MKKGLEEGIAEALLKEFVDSHGRTPDEQELKELAQRGRGISHHIRSWWWLYALVLAAFVTYMVLRNE